MKRRLDFTTRMVTLHFTLPHRTLKVRNYELLDPFQRIGHGVTLCDTLREGEAAGDEPTALSLLNLYLEFHYQLRREIQLPLSIPPSPT